MSDVTSIKATNMKNKICDISLFSAVLACVATMPGDVFCAQNTGWADARAQQSYAGAYNQVATMQQQQAYIESQDIPVVQTASATTDLPIEVEDKKIKEKILNNDPNAPTADELERCAMTDIRGVFKWGIPQSGIHRSLKPQCVAVVDLITEDENGKKVVLATTTVAAGDAIRCNIDEFPEDGYSNELANIELPADNPPTMKDVEKVMDKEQKQNAGFKIAAAAIVGGLAGNILGPKKAGDEKLLGTDNKQLGTTALGAGVAAGLMAASSYSGKVAGDTIKSTAINATAGMMAGNMAAGMMGSNSVLATMRCTVDEGNGKTSEKDCVAGRYQILAGALSDSKTINEKSVTVEYYTNMNQAEVYECQLSGDAISKCDRFNTPIVNVILEGSNNTFLQNITDWNNLKQYAQCYADNVIKGCDGVQSDQRFYKIKSASTTTGTSQAGYAVFDNLPNKMFGYKVSDFEKLKTNPKIEYYKRNTSSGLAYEKVTTEGTNSIKKDNIVFTPSARSAQDGSIIDLSNEARAKSTMIGAAAGGALGGFTGYQGAQSEITERYLSALYEYEGSLSNFVCVTGARFLYEYNGLAVVPQMPSTTSSTESQ